MNKDFKVTLMDEEHVKKLFLNWGLASVKCYKTPKKYAERVGKSCLATAHFSGSRGQYITFEIENVPRALVDQLVRAEVGVFKNVESQRYVNYEECFYYYTPPLIGKDEELSKYYVESMELIQQRYVGLVNLLKVKYPNLGGEAINETARGLLPMNINSTLVIGFTVEALINLCHKRLCVCSQEHIRKLVRMMRQEVIGVHPELEPYLVAVCVAHNYCPESPKRTCGAYPQKDVVTQLVLEWKKNQNK